MNTSRRPAPDSSRDSSRANRSIPSVRASVAALAVLALCACAANPYKQFYTPSPRDLSSNPDVTFLQPGEQPEVYSTDDMERDARDLRSKNYVAIGSSSFNGGAASKDAVIQQAKDIGAKVVLVQRKYTGTQTSTIPLFIPSTQTSQTSGMIYGTGGSANYTGTTTTYGTNVVPMTSQQDRFDQGALYFVEHRPKMKFGVSFAPLTLKQRTHLDRNTGAFVDVVFEGYPAFNAELLPNDVVIAVNGAKIYGPQDTMELLGQVPYGGSVVLTVLRRGEQRDIIIRLPDKAPGV